MAVCAEAIEQWREILRKIYYAGQPVVTDAALKLVIDALIEDMITTLSCTTYDVDDVIRLVVNLNTDFDTIISGVSGKKILVLNMSLTATATSSNILFYSEGNVFDTEVYRCAVIDTAPVGLQPSDWGWFECLSGEGLKIEKTGGDVEGIINYVLLDADVPS